MELAIAEAIEGKMKWLKTCAEENTIIDHNRDITYYFRNLVFMEREAEMSLKDGSWARAYVLYFRYILIALETLPKHPQWRLANKSDKQLTSDKLLVGRVVKQVMEKCEALKKKLKSLFEQQEREILLAKEAELRSKLAKVEITPTLEDLPKPVWTSPDALSNGLFPGSLAAAAAASNVTTGVSSASKDIFSSLRSNSQELRSVFIPKDLISVFITLAGGNSWLNLETCGFLCGFIRNNELHISTLILPKQKATSDSCEALDEGELFTVMDQKNLIALGWIHTHPSQTSFMSSVDLHCHAPFQMMLKEAVAIVCSIKYRESKYFRLVQPHGLNLVSGCTQTGHHSHPEPPPIYEECGHCRELPDTAVIVMDLR